MKNSKIEIRIDEDIKNKLQAMLAPKGVTISAFLREYILRYIKEENSNG